MLEGFRFRLAEVIAVPRNEKVVAERIAVLARTTRPSELPVLFGEYMIWRAVRSPGASLSGNFCPVILKSVLSIWLRVRTMAERVLLTMVFVSTAVFPTSTVPKSKLVSVGTRPGPKWAVGWLSSRAEQPSITVRRRRTIANLQPMPRCITGGPQ